MTDQAGGPNDTSAGSAASTPATEPDWTDQVTDLIVDSVDKVRDRTTGPILDYSRISVHALVALLLMGPIGVLFLVGAVRLLTWAVGEAWIAYAILGTIFVLVGVVLWSRRSKLPR